MKQCSNCGDPNIIPAQECRTCKYNKQLDIPKPSKPSRKHMKQVTFSVTINASSLNWTDIEQIYDIIECNLKGKKLYSNEYTITTIIE